MEQQKTIDNLLKPWTLHWLKKGEKIGIFGEEEIKNERTKK